MGQLSQHWERPFEDPFAQDVLSNQVATCAGDLALAVSGLWAEASKFG